MKIRDLRILVIGIVIAATLVVLFAGQFVYQRLNVEKPLFKLYGQTKMVDKAVINDKDNQLKVILTMKKTDNLKQAYSELMRSTEKVAGKKSFAIEIKDKRTPELEKAFYQSQFVIYEAIAKGDFTKMESVVHQQALDVHANERLYIDEKNVYVEFVKGENYLYEIIPRTEKIETGSQWTGSGV